MTKVKLNPVKPKTNAEQIREYFTAFPDRVFSRQDVADRFPDKNTLSVYQAVTQSCQKGFLTRVTPGKYQLNKAGPSQKTVVEKAKEYLADEKRTYKKREAGPTGDAIIYLNHARAAIANKDSAGYMLVSLALYTLQGKMP